jgi:hypothetical protein
MGLRFMGDKPTEAEEEHGQALEDATSTALEQNGAGIPRHDRWKAKFMFALVVVGAIITLLWVVFLGSLLAYLVLSSLPLAANFLAA